MAAGVEHGKAEGFSLADAVARLNKVLSTIDALFIAPMRTGEDDQPAADQPAADEAAADEGAEEGSDEAAPVGGAAAEEAEEPAAEETPSEAESTYADAEEKPSNLAPEI